MCVLTTGYCPCSRCCGKWANGKTALGFDVREHPYGFAADFKLLPPLTRLDVPGYGSFLVDDTGSAMRENAARLIVHIDLRFVTHKRAAEWGRRWLWIALPLAVPAVVVAAGAAPKLDDDQ